MKRLGVICDLAEEQWASMDLVAEMLMLNAPQHPNLIAQSICPPFKFRFCNALAPSGGLRFNIDRFLNRWADYPRFLARRVKDFDCFHICDHSYAHLAFSLPRQRTGVFCHDLNAFRSLLYPELENRPLWFRTMARRTLRGLQRASVVFYTTDVVKQEILAAGLRDEQSLVKAPYGISPEYTEQPEDRPPEIPGLDTIGDRPFLLHVGMCAPRKRIDVLLDVYAAVLRMVPDLWLVQVGGEWTPAQRAQIQRLGIAKSILQLGRQNRKVVGDFYRRASLVLMPSENEGFGLPVIEAIACGAPLVASDIPVLREVGEQYAVYCRLADIDHWSETIVNILRGIHPLPNLEDRLRHARKFTWAAHTRTILSTYDGL